MVQGKGFLVGIRARGDNNTNIYIYVARRWPGQQIQPRRRVPSLSATGQFKRYGWKKLLMPK